MNVAPRSELRVLSLCSGVGMHDVGLGAVFATRTICYVEREAFAASQLVGLMEAECLDQAPVWSDLATFDARPWRGVVDCIVAGLPCQPYSVAGKREGNTDKRAFGEGDGPIPHFLRIVAECRPAVVFLENVPAWVVGGWFRPVGEQLCRLGLELESPLFLAASDVGAPHQRERVWIMAYEPSRGQRVLRESWRGVELGNTARSGFSGSGSEPRSGSEGVLGSLPAVTPMEDAARPQLSGGRRRGISESSRVVDDARGDVGPAQERRGAEGERVSVRTARSDLRGASRGPSSAVAISGDIGRERHSGVGRTAERRFEHGSSDVEHTNRADREGQHNASGCTGLPSRDLFAPGPSEGRWPDILREAPWLAPATESGIHGVVDGTPLVVDESRRHQLRALGNGGVPLCSAVAFASLARRIMNLDASSSTVPTGEPQR